MTVEKLTGQAAGMEKELKDLLDSINKQRLEFHALNYFTTQQLLQIRRELGNLKQDSTREITPSLYSLLSSFSLYITSDEIKDAVEVVCSILNEQEANEQEGINEKQESNNEAFEVQVPLATEASITTETCVTTQPELPQYNSVNDEHVGQENSVKELIENLSKDEEEIFEQLHDDLEYSDIVCYKAVKYAFSSNSDDKLNEAMKWCLENSSQYENDAITTPSVSSDDKNVNINVSNNTQEPSYRDAPSEMNKSPPKENIDIKHLVVQKLIKSNFTPELAIKGARMFNGNFEQAFEWCLKSENKNIEPQQSSFVSFSSVLPVPQFELAMDTVR